jgi:hypothetical protein
MSIMREGISCLRGASGHGLSLPLASRRLECDLQCSLVLSVGRMQAHLFGEVNPHSISDRALEANWRPSFRQEALLRCQRSILGL